VLGVINGGFGTAKLEAEIVGTGFPSTVTVTRGYTVTSTVTQTQLAQTVTQNITQTRTVTGE